MYNKGGMKNKEREGIAKSMWYVGMWYVVCGGFLKKKKKRRKEKFGSTNVHQGFVKETIHRQNLLIDNLHGSRSETRDRVIGRGERRETQIASEPIQMNRNARREHLGEVTKGNDNNFVGTGE